MAEAHPVGFRWVMKAKERGARVIHVDPRFGRTSQLSDLHVPIRAGTDVAFLGGIIRHVIETESYFKEYVVNYTNASTLVCDAFRDTEELEGLFSGFDAAKSSYDPASWGYEDCAIGFSAGVAGARNAGIQRAHRRGHGPGERQARRHAPGSALCFSGPAPSLQPLYAGDGGANLRDPA